MSNEKDYLLIDAAMAERCPFLKEGQKWQESLDGRSWNRPTVSVITTHPDFRYRLKPEPSECWRNKYVRNDGKERFGGDYNSHDEAKRCNLPDIGETYIGAFRFVQAED